MRIIVEIQLRCDSYGNDKAYSKSPAVFSEQSVNSFAAMSALEQYRLAFSRLNLGHVSGAKEKAPHKPVLLLAVLDEIESGSITGNRIYITPELVARFKDNWSRYVTGIHFSADFAKPFFHLKGERFWYLMMQPGRGALLTSSGSPKSFRSLKDSVLYAWLDDGLYALLQNAPSRQVLRAALLSAYFNDAAAGKRGGYISEVEGQILHDSPAQYRQAALAFDEEEVAARSGVFKRVIPRIYNYTCCISGMRIIAGDAVQMVDACHIVPFAESRDDTIANGLSLCPNLHRAFDRGLIRIDADYRVVVSAAVSEIGGAYGIKAFDGKRIALPLERGYWPGLEHLERHWARWSNG